MLLNYLRRYGGNQWQRAAVAGAGIRSLQYEENLLPPFYDTLTQYVERATAPLLALDINMVRSLKSICRTPFLRFLW